MIYTFIYLRATYNIFTYIYVCMYVYSYISYIICISYIHVKNFIEIS